MANSGIWNCNGASEVGILRNARVIHQDQGLELKAQAQNWAGQFGALP